MWPLGHAAIGYLCYRSATRARGRGPAGYGSALVLALGTQFPDLVDKPLAWGVGVIPSGSGPAHSLVVLSALATGFWCCARRYGRGEYAVAFGIGAVAHALTDAVEILWNPYVTTGSLLWPLGAVSPPTAVAFPFEPLSELYVAAEFLLAGLALRCWHRDGFPGLERIRAALYRARPAPN